MAIKPPGAVQAVVIMVADAVITVSGGCWSIQMAWGHAVGVSQF